jgi:hypothetical protein
MKKPILSTVLFFLLFSGFAMGQKQRFYAAGVFGLNMAQIDGDYNSGYRKPGIQAALRGVALLTDKIYLATEMSFSQQGAISESSPRMERKIKGVEDLNIRLNYVEVPILLGFRSKKINKSFYRNEWQFGVSIAQLMGQKIEHQINYRDVEVLLKYEPLFNDRIISGLIGYKVNMDSHWGLGFRHNLALTYFFKNPETPVQGQRHYFYLRPYHFSALVYYTL